MRWAGHVVRMKEDRAPRIVIENISAGKRPLGRPRTR